MEIHIKINKTNTLRKIKEKDNIMQDIRMNIEVGEKKNIHEKHSQL